MFYIPIKLRSEGTPLAAQTFQVLAIADLALGALGVVLAFLVPPPGNLAGDQVLLAFGIAAASAASALVLRLIGDAVAGIYEVRNEIRALHKTLADRG